MFAFARGENGQIKGSGRSIPGLHLKDALDPCWPNALPACCCALAATAWLPARRCWKATSRAFAIYCAGIADELIAPPTAHGHLETDGQNRRATFRSRPLPWKTRSGQGFPAPIFEDEFVVENQRILKEKHLKLRLRKGEQRLEAINSTSTGVLSATIRAAYRWQSTTGGVQARS